MIKNITCTNCNSFGIYDAGYHDPKECPECNGSGHIIKYANGALAKYRGGPFLGREAAVQPK